MKTKFKVLLAVAFVALAGFAFITAANAYEGCPEGMHEECTEACNEVLVQPATNGHCAHAPYYKHDGNSANCSLKNQYKWLRLIGYPQTIQGDWVEGTPAVYETQCETVCACVDDPPPIPQGEWCGRCSNKFEGWVTWYDRNGGCDGDYYNQRTEYPGDERCVDSEPTPEVPEIPYCDWKQYVLRDTEGHICYIQRNYAEKYLPNKLPKHYNNTSLMREICSKDCLGNPLPWKFGELDSFWTTCGECDGACE